MKIKSGDKVKVVSGKYKGKSSEVLKVMLPDRVLVKNVNIVKKHTKAKGKEPGGIIEIEKPIHSSNVMVVCKNCKRPVRIGVKVEDGKRVRVCKKCNKQI